jgi:hypothetical protein
MSGGGGECDGNDEWLVSILIHMLVNKRLTQKLWKLTIYSVMKRLAVYVAEFVAIFSVHIS